MYIEKYKLHIERTLTRAFYSKARAIAILLKSALRIQMIQLTILLLHIIKCVRKTN